MKAWKLFSTLVLCSGLVFGFGLFGCGDDDDEKGSVGGCTVDADCDDGLFCNGTETCDATLGCVAGDDPCPDPLGCDEDNDQCTCVDDAECDDDLFCNGVETCVDDVCQAGTPEDCDDGVECTVDSCNEDTDACDNTPDDGDCDDGVFCNGAETCDALEGCEAGDDPCPDPLGCDEENDQCTGCVDDADCDDDLFCNGAETCVDNVCEAGDDPCPDPLDCDEENDQCVEAPTLIPAALLSVASGCETYIGAHPVAPGAMLCGAGGDELCVLEYDFCANGDAVKRWNPSPGEAIPGDTEGTGTWSYVGNELTIDTTGLILGSSSNTVETYDVAFTYDDGARLDLHSAAQITPGDGSTVVGDYERHASTVATTGGAFAAVIDSTADTTMTVTDGAWEATTVDDNECTGSAFVCGLVPPGGTTVTTGTFVMPGSLYELGSTYIFQTDDSLALVLERQ